MICRLNNLSTELDALYRRAARQLGVPDSELRILYAISELGDGCRLSEVCRLSGLTKQTVNSALRRLECEEVLTLGRDVGKYKRIFLTEHGRLRLEESAGRLYAAESRAAASFTPSEAEEYLRLMKKYNDAFERELRAL